MHKQSTIIFRKMLSVMLLFLVHSNNICESSDTGVEVTSNTPRIQFESLAFDFGKITPDKAREIEKTFTFKNTGTKVLVIEDIERSCGCIATTSTRKVPPGQSGTIKVRLTLDSYRGKQVKRIFVLSNDPQQPKTIIQIQGFIESQLTVLPSHIHFGRLTRGMQAKKVVTVINSASNDLVLECIECSSKHIVANILRKTQDEKKFPEIEVTLLPTMPPGQIHEVLTVRTNDEKNHILSVEISGVVGNEMVAFPDRISFGVVKRSGSPKRSIMLMSKHRNFNILETRSSSKLISVGIVKKEGKKKYQITVQLAPSTPDGFFNDKLEIVTDWKSHPVVEIPVYAFIN